jgi:hypothetical protein
MAILNTFDNGRMYTIETTSDSYRYFNGRRYHIQGSTEHYVFPREAKRNFTLHRHYVAVARKTFEFSDMNIMYHDFRAMRFSLTSTGR